MRTIREVLPLINPPKDKKRTQKIRTTEKDLVFFRAWRSFFELHSVKKEEVAMPEIAILQKRGKKTTRRL